VIEDDAATFPDLWVGAGGPAFADRADAPYCHVVPSAPGTVPDHETVEIRVTHEQLRWLLARLLT